MGTMTKVIKMNVMIVWIYNKVILHLEDLK